jgi:leader peptidase (prepilin peptidase) / N-methyltransferase
MFAPFRASHYPSSAVAARVLGLLVGGCALFGLAFGSFLNVVIYRVPRHESIVSPRSACPNCHAPIRERDNIPLISWLVLRGKCRDCHSPISVRYPLVELGTAALFAAGAARIGFNWELPAFLVLFAALFALACIDVERLVLPKMIVYPTLALVAGLLLLAAGATGHWHNLLIAVIYGVGWFVFFFALNAANPSYLGFGDVRLAPVLGLALGWLGWKYVILGFFAANFFGAFIGLALIAAKKARYDQPIPYGVYLAIGTVFAVLLGPDIVTHF